MCCDSWENYSDAVGECPECGAPIDVDGDAVGSYCNYSPRCNLCGASPCDGSC